jgi:hypothetical protein
MTARTRIALLAVIGSIGLVSLAYGAGGMVGGGSPDASGGPSDGAGAAGPMPAIPQVDQGTKPRHRGPCHRGQGRYGSHGSHGAGPSTDGTTAPPPADSY